MRMKHSIEPSIERSVPFFFPFVCIMFLAMSSSVLPGSSENKKAVDALVNPMHDPVLVTVGGPEADIPGYTSRAIQLGIDAVKSRGGGTIHLNPGIFEISGPIRLSSNMVLDGSGEKTVLKKSEGITTSFSVDADWGMLKVSVKAPGGFRAGDGIQLYDDLHNQGWDVTTALITAIRGDVLYLDNSTIHDYIASKNGTISNSFSLIEAVDVENVRIANLIVDGNRASNLYINGCRGGGVYLHKTRNSVIDGVHVRYFNGDSFSWQVTENITVQNCEASYGGGLGFHPGTGSDHSIVENNISHHNDQDGFFLCWRVQNSEFSNNTSYGNGRFGVSIGHKDTDNLFEKNHIYENAFHGVRFREENEQNGGHRNTFRNNVIENNGTSGEDAYGFSIAGVTHDILIENNTIRSTGKGSQVAAVHIGPSAERISIENNQITGHPKVVKE